MIYASGSLSSSGSLAKTAAMRCASSRVSSSKPATRLLLEIYVGKGLPVGVLHHKAAIQFLD